MPKRPAEKPPLKAVSGATVKPREVEWLVKNVFVRGSLNTVQGAPGIGKTFLLCAYVAAISTGGLVQGTDGLLESVPKGRVLYLSGDDDIETTIVPRLLSMNADMSNVFFQPDGSAPYIGSPELEQLIDDVKPLLVILDTFHHYLPPHTNTNSMSRTTAILQPLNALARKHNFSAVVIQHIGKQASSGRGGLSVNFGLGSAAINGLFRSVWTLARLKDEDGSPSNTRALLPSKTNLVAGDVPAILFELSFDCGFEWAGISENLTAEEAYSSKRSGKGRPPEASEDAEELLRNYLTIGATPAEEIFHAAKQAGIGKTTLKAVKKSMGVVSYWDGRTSYWSFIDGSGQVVNN